MRPCLQLEARHADQEAILVRGSNGPDGKSQSRPTRPTRKWRLHATTRGIREKKEERGSKWQGPQAVIPCKQATRIEWQGKQKPMACRGGTVQLWGAGKEMSLGSEKSLHLVVVELCRSMRSNCQLDTVHLVCLHPTWLTSTLKLVICGR